MNREYPIITIYNSRIYRSCEVGIGNGPNGCSIKPIEIVVGCIFNCITRYKYRYECTRRSGGGHGTMFVGRNWKRYQCNGQRGNGDAANVIIVTLQEGSIGKCDGCW